MQSTQAECITEQLKLNCASNIEIVEIFSHDTSKGDIVDAD